MREDSGVWIFEYSRCSIARGTLVSFGRTSSKELMIIGHCRGGSRLLFLTIAVTARCTVSLTANHLDSVRSTNKTQYFVIELVSLYARYTHPLMSP